jgi:cytoskeletal protein RodZ
MFKKLAGELVEARKKSEITLKQISAKTRIDFKFLEAMEEGNFSFLPELYVRAFLKEYALQVGLDEKKTLLKYEAAKQGKFYEEPEEKVETKEEIKGEKEASTEEKSPLEEKPTESAPKLKYVTPVQSFEIPPEPPSGKDYRSIAKKRKQFYIIGSVAAVVFVFLVYLIFFSKKSEIIVQEKPVEEIIAEQQKRFEEKHPNDFAAGKIEQTDSLILNIYTSDSSWIRILMDDNRVDEFLLFPQGQKTIRAGNNFKITFGNSGGIQLRLNYKQLEFTGKPKAVSHVLINKSGIQMLNKAPELPEAD